MAVQEAWPEISPHTTHLHLLGQLPEARPDEAYLYPNQRAALELISNERANPQTPTIEIVEIDGVAQEITVVNMLMRAYTRFGKFEVVTSDFRRFKEENPDAKGLFLAHTRGLVEESRAKFDRRESDRPAHVRLSTAEFHGNRKDKTDVDMVFATIQSMHGRDGYRFAPDAFDYVIVDESHHSKAPTHEKLIVEHFTPQIRIGMTATPNRLDQLDIRELYGQEVVDIPLAEGIVQGRLRPLQYKVMLEDTVRQKVEAKTATTAELNKATRQVDPNLRQMVERGDQEIAAAGITEPRTMHFAQSIEQAEDIIACKPHAVVMHSAQSDAINNNALMAFNSGEVSDIVSVNMLNEGRDVQGVNVIAFYRSTESENIFLQQLGRGLRPAEDGSPLLVLDYVANAKRLEFLYNLMHGISDYALNAKAYKAKNITEKGAKTKVKAELEATSKLGATFELDDELLKVMESISDQQDFMDRKARFDAIDAFEAHAYVSKILRTSTIERRFRGYIPKPAIERNAKEGNGPTLRSILAASGETLDSLLWERLDRSADQKTIKRDLNNLQMPDLLILLAQDLVLRHAQATNSLEEDKKEKVFWAWRTLELYKEFGISIALDVESDHVFIETKDGQKTYIVPFFDRVPVESGAHKWSVKQYGWMLAVNDDQGDGISKNTFYPETTEEPLPAEVEEKFADLIHQIAAIRHQLQERGELADSYPFYAFRNMREVNSLLNTFTGQGPSEWTEYETARLRVGETARHANLVKQTIKSGGIKASMFGQYLDETRTYDINVVPGTDTILFNDVTEPEQPIAALEVDVRANAVRDLLIHEKFPELDISENIHIVGSIGEEIRKNFDRAMGNKIIDSQDMVARVARKERILGRERALKRGDQWLTGFIDKATLAQSYIPTDRLAEFDPYGDDIVGKHIQWEAKKQDGTFARWQALVSSIDYKEGVIRYEPLIPIMYGRAVQKLKPLQRNKKTGELSRRPGVRNLIIW